MTDWTRRVYIGKRVGDKWITERRGVLTEKSLIWLDDSDHPDLIVRSLSNKKAQ